MARLVNNLSKYARTAPKAAERALLQTGADILAVAKQLVPVDTSSLQKSGGVVPVTSAIVHVGFGGPGEYFDGRKPEEYAVYVEYGTSEMDAQPFLTPAFLQATETFKKRLTEEMKKDQSG